jgi:cephalosporin hydroxylase
MNRKNIGYILIFTSIIIFLILVNLKEYEKFENSILKQYNVIFAGTVRNAEKYIENNLKNIDKCGNKFNSYKVIIYENDSSDKTRKILEENKKDNYIYIFEDNIKEPLRTIRISNGRNKILDKVREINSNNEYNFLVMMDLDDINSSGKFVDSIESCFNNMDWDVLTGNQSDTYYDIWAFRKKSLLDYDCWKEVRNATSNGMNQGDAENKYVWDVIKKFEPQGLIEVDSAFGGIAIYKLKSIPNHCSYKGKYDEDNSELCEHVPFNNCIKNAGGKNFINTEFLTN